MTGQEEIQTWDSEMMAWMYSFRDTFFPVDERLDRLGIAKGATVIDYGCD